MDDDDRVGTLPSIPDAARSEKYLRDCDIHGSRLQCIKYVGIVTPSQKCWRMPRFLNLGIRWIAMFYTRLESGSGRLLQLSGFRHDVRGSVPRIEQ